MKNVVGGGVVDGGEVMRLAVASHSEWLHDRMVPAGMRR
jgi:hypothetical protein